MKFLLVHESKIGQQKCISENANVCVSSLERNSSKRFHNFLDRLSSLRGSCSTDQQWWRDSVWSDLLWLDLFLALHWIRSVATVWPMSRVLKPNYPNGIENLHHAFRYTFYLIIQALNSGGHDYIKWVPYKHGLQFTKAF